MRGRAQQRARQHRRGADGLCQGAIRTATHAKTLEFRDQLPLTNLGKIDKQALKSLCQA